MAAASSAGTGRLPLPQPRAQTCSIPWPMPVPGPQSCLAACTPAIAGVQRPNASRPWEAAGFQTLKSCGVVTRGCAGSLPSLQSAGCFHPAHCTVACEQPQYDQLVPLFSLGGTGCISPLHRLFVMSSLSQGCHVGAVGTAGYSMLPW